MVALVLLLPEAPSLDSATITTKLGELYPGQFHPDLKGANDSFVTEGPHPRQLLIKSVIPDASGMFFLSAVPKLYTEFSSFAASIKDPTLKAAVSRHHAWLSVEHIGEIGSIDEAYRFIGRTLAHIAPATVLAIAHPGSGQSVPFGATTRDQLRAPLVLQALGFTDPGKLH